MAPLQYGLNIRKTGPPGAARPAQIKKRTIFDDDGDDDAQETLTTTAADNPTQEISVFDLDARPSSRTAASSKPPLPSASVKSSIKSKNGTAVAPTPDLSTLRTQKQRQAEAESLDSSIYDYDAAYDAAHAQTAAKKAAEQANAIQRKPKYMENLLAAAEVRKRDQLRAEDRLRQKEREAEGEEFKETEEFVTEAYKKQQEELRRVEEQEKAKEEREAEKRRKAGMGGFHRKIMEEEEARHAEAVEAAKNVAKGRALDAQPLVEENEDNAEKSAAELARDLNAKGANIVINEEGQVTDKRQLLSAGLNVALKRKADGSVAEASPVTQRPVQRPDYRSRAAEDSKRAMRERQTRMVEAQLEQAAKKAAEEEAEERAKVERAAKSRKTEGEISSARERFLQRKKEAAAAAVAGEK